MARSMWRMPFGQYMNEDIEGLPNLYLRWLLEQEWFEEKFAIGYRAVKRELEYREANNIVIKEE